MKLSYRRPEAPGNRALRDLIILLAIFIPLFLLAHFLHIFHELAMLTTGYLPRDLEIYTLLLMTVAALGIFSLLRLRELRREVNRRRGVEEQLELRNKDLKEFSHTISHDLQNPLAVAKGFAGGAKRPPLHGKKDLEMESLEQISESIIGMSSMIEQLLAYAEAGRPEGGMAAVEPLRIIWEILGEYRDKAREYGSRIKVKNHFPLILVDASMFRQVFANLLANAIKYTESNRPSEIEIGWLHQKEEAIFYARAKGVGVPLNEQRVIFEPFQRGGPSGAPGHGMGLFIVRKA